MFSLFSWLLKILQLHNFIYTNLLNYHIIIKLHNFGIYYHGYFIYLTFKLHFDSISTWLRCSTSISWSFCKDRRRLWCNEKSLLSIVKVGRKLCLLTFSYTVYDLCLSSVVLDCILTVCLQSLLLFSHSKIICQF